MTVSVIMPVYNGEEYLHDSITSVLKQTYKKLEFIIIDDASTDATNRIIKYYCKIDNRIKLIKNNYNMKIVKSLNVGIKAAKGELIARIDVDDYWTINKLEKQVQFLNKNKNIKLLGCSVILIDKSKTQIFNNLYFNKEKEMREDDVKKQIIKRNLFCHSGVIFRREIIDIIGTYNEKYINSEDYEYWLRIVKKFDGVVLQDKLVYHRLTKDSYSYQNRKEQFIYSLRARISTTNYYGIKWIFSKNVLLEIIYILTPNFIIKLRRKILNR